MTEIIEHLNDEPNQEIQIRHLSIDDIENLIPILECWVKNPETDEVITEEVADIKNKMINAVNGTSSERQYFVAEGESGEPVGVMGLAFPSERMKDLATTERPIEIINAFVSDEVRGKGVGGQLLENVLAVSKFIGATEVMVNSGPRYKESAWKFYDSKFGERAHTLKNEYGPGLDAPVWIKKMQ